MLILKLKGHARAGESLGCEIPSTSGQDKEQSITSLVFCGSAKGKHGGLKFLLGKNAQGLPGCLWVDTYPTIWSRKNQVEPQHPHFQKEDVFVCSFSLIY